MSRSTKHRSNTNEAIDASGDIEQVGDDQAEEDLQTFASEKPPAQPEPVPAEVSAPKGVGGSYRINENGIRVKL